MSVAAISRGTDGFYHPGTEEELVALVKRANRDGRQLRVRGAAHSIPDAIYADDGDHVNVMLDRYGEWTVKDEGRKLVEAQAGIHIGVWLSQMASQKRWTLGDTGGITHQTVSGFSATGSSGGSLQFSSDGSLAGFRVIDGTGEVHEFSRDDPDPDRFRAMAPNLGLLGVVSTISFECVDSFDVAGQEAVTGIDDGSIDMFGDGDAGRPSLEQFLRDAEFARVEWWPQRGAERAVTWQCQRLRRQPGFRACRYERWGPQPDATQHLVSLLYTILGNLDDLSRAKQRMEDDFDHLEDVLALLAEKRLGRAGRLVADVLSRAVEAGVDSALTVLEPAAPLIERSLPDFFPELIDLFVPLDSEKEGIRAGQPQSFRDCSWQGLPMDNAVSAVLAPAQFTEAWVPLPRTAEVMRLLRDYFSEPDDDRESYRRTGTYAWELYAAMPAEFWLSPAYSSGRDEWREGAFRVDPYWFAENLEDPRETLFAGLWKLLRDADVPFRLHWGKYQPKYDRGDRDWVDFFRSQYPRWDDFLSLRAELDPDEVFLTTYWRDRFGLW